MMLLMDTSPPWWVHPPTHTSPPSLCVCVCVCVCGVQAVRRTHRRLGLAQKLMDQVLVALTSDPKCCVWCRRPERWSSVLEPNMSRCT